MKWPQPAFETREMSENILIDQEIPHRETVSDRTGEQHSFVLMALQQRQPPQPFLQESRRKPWNH